MMKKAYLVDTIAGVVALDPEFSVIGVEPYPRDPAQAAERALKLERGDLPEEVEKLCRELRDKVEIFVVEHEEEARKLREKLGVEVDVEKPSEGGLYARSHLEEVAAALGFASLDDYLKFAYEASLAMARAKIREAAEKRDKFVAQAIEALDELDRTINILVSRVREWYGLHFPEMDDLVPSHREYVAIVKQFGLRQKITIDGLKALGFEEKRAKEIVSAAERSMGANVSEFDIEAIAKLANLVSEMYNLRREFEVYIDTAMEEIAPNIRALVGPTLGARLIALAWLSISLVRLALSARGGLGLLVGWADEYGRRKTYLYRRMYRPVRPKRNPHVLVVGTTGGGKSNLLKLLVKRELKEPRNLLVVDFTGEYRYLARQGFKVVDARTKCIDVFSCDPHTVAEALRVAFPEAGELSAAVVETRLRDSAQEGLKAFAERLIAESEEVKAATTRSALRSIGEKLRVLAEEVEGVGLDPRELLRGLKILSLDGLLHEESKAFIAELALRVMFSEAPRRPLNLTLVVDEAHRLIPAGRLGVEPIIVRVMREARKYEVKVCAATQSLKDLAEAAVGNFDTVWVAGGLASTDRDYASRKWGDFVADAASGLTTGYAVDLMDASASKRATRPFTVRVVRIPRFKEEAL